MEVTWAKDVPNLRGREGVSGFFVHLSHCTLEVVKLAAKHHNIVIFCLPLHIPQLTVSHLIPHASSHQNFSFLHYFQKHGHKVRTYDNF